MLGNIEIPYFCHSIMEDDVGWLDVSVYDFCLMKFVESFKNVIDNLPYFLLGNSSLSSRSFLDTILNNKINT